MFISAIPRSKLSSNCHSGGLLVVRFFATCCSGGSEGSGVVQRSQVLHHGVAHPLKVVLWRPSPIPLGVGVVECLWPRVSNRLTMIRSVIYLKIRDSFSDFVSNFCRGEGNSGDIVSPQGQGVGGTVHELHDRAEAVVDVHHGKACLRAQVAGVVTLFKGLVEYVDCVVRSAPTGHCVT